MPDLVQLFLIGVVSSYGACFLSCWPIALPYVTATGETSGERLKAAFSFLFAKMGVYALLGAAATFWGRLMIGWVAHNANALFIISGIAVLFLGARAAFSGTHPCGTLFKRVKVKTKVASAALLGIFAGILPCATSMAVMAYIAFSAQNPVSGAALGFAFGVGKFFSPLIPASLLSNYVESRFKVNRGWIRGISALLVIMLGLRLIQTGIVDF